MSKTIGLASLFPKSKTLASYNMTYADPDEMIEVDAISGSFFCIRRDVYEKLNGFDEDFFMYGEDLDLCFRTKEMGLHNYYTPVTNILHFKGQSCRTRRWGSYVDFYKAMLIFVKKHKDLYFVPNFLVSFGIMFAAFVGMFSRLIPKFWKMFLDLGMIAVWAIVSLRMECYDVGGCSFEVNSVGRIVGMGDCGGPDSAPTNCIWIDAPANAPQEEMLAKQYQKKRRRKNAVHAAYRKPISLTIKTN